jgi:hypothetical protein
MHFSHECPQHFPLPFKILEMHSVLCVANFNTVFPSSILTIQTSFPAYNVMYSTECTNVYKNVNQHNLNTAQLVSMHGNVN